MAYNILLASMSVLGFYLPTESEEKIGMGVTILIALVFIMQTVTEMQPPSSDIPIISTYFTLNMGMVTSSVVRYFTNL